MTFRTLAARCGVFAALAVAACGAPQDAEDAAAQKAAAEAPAPSPLAETPPPTPAPPPVAALRTGSGPKGSQVSLVRAQVTGNVLTVELSWRTPDQGAGLDVYYFNVDQVSVIDDATSQRYGVLKDDSEAWMASPLNTDGRQVRVQTDDGKPTVVWFKLPAPPATSQTVSINIPTVSPFDGVPVQR